MYIFIRSECREWDRKNRNKRE